MSLSDPIADMLTRIRNALMARHEFVLVPASKIKISMVKVLKEEGFIKDYEVLKSNTPQRVIKIYFVNPGKKQSVLNGLQRVSKPGLRVYCGKNEIPRVYGGLGIAMVSTSQGIMTGQQAWKRGLGGEVLCYVW
ncbi:MAG: 30S ribosomal protein S8 [Chloroflexota bacterium]|nr:30S ribosomal protein S8 [Chloroflexota bacterium]